ncbi:hypothetical protein ACFV1W_34810 [Kitasatospora sp. NPDC059648]|uniref:hypothetical protein n=1 Tax=Kitasatospora sp. NPDC059648 TaxID=3346894 RepID=UPI0036B874A9
MHDASRLQSAAADGHAQGVGDQFGPVVVGHRVADHLDTGLVESWKAGRLVGPVVKVCAAEAALLTAAERGAA